MTPLSFDEGSYLGGGARYPLNLARAVAMDDGWQVELIFYGAVERTRSLPVADGVSLTVVPAAGTPNGPLSWQLLPALLDVDLVHIHQIFSRSSEVALVMAKTAGRPVCVTDHGGRTSLLGESLGTLELADRVIACSRFGADLVPGECDPAIVPGGVDDGFFSPAQPELPREHILFVGRLLPHQGVDQLIRAIPPEVKLVICGRPHRDDYQALLHELSFGKQVEFVCDAGDEEIRAFYRQAIAVVLPSVDTDHHGDEYAWPEPMGLTLLEGMACGAPGIGSRVGGVPEYVEDGLTGFIYDDIAGLTSAIRRLAGDPPLVARLGGEAERRVRERFGLAPAGEALRAIYDDVLAGQAVR